MHIDIELKGYNGFGWKVCDNCPCRHSGEFGGECQLNYWEPCSNYDNGWLNLDTGEIREGNSLHPPDREHIWYSVWIRPQKCIDEHGR